MVIIAYVLPHVKCVTYLTVCKNVRCSCNGYMIGYTPTLGSELVRLPGGGKWNTRVTFDLPPVEGLPRAGVRGSNVHLFSNALQELFPGLLQFLCLT